MTNYGSDKIKFWIETIKLSENHKNVDIGSIIIMKLHLKDNTTELIVYADILEIIIIKLTAMYQMDKWLGLSTYLSWFKVLSSDPRTLLIKHGTSPSLFIARV